MTSPSVAFASPTVTSTSGPNIRRLLQRSKAPTPRRSTSVGHPPTSFGRNRLIPSISVHPRRQRPQLLPDPAAPPHCPRRLLRAPFGWDIPVRGHPSAPIHDISSGLSSPPPTRRLLPADRRPARLRRLPATALRPDPNQRSVELRLTAKPLHHSVFATPYVQHPVDPGPFTPIYHPSSPLSITAARSNTLSALYALSQASSTGA